MNRTMIDVTHDGLPAALPAIRALPAGNVVALYDTGSPDIAATPGDIAEIPSNLYTVFIDQGFTGSPNMHATVRDCENGAWSLANAVDKTGWHPARPTLYLGYPDTVTLAYQAGWRGDVWVVRPSDTAPTSPPAVPQGMTVVAVQWNYPGAYDGSVIFDPTWPGGTVTTPPPVPDPAPVVTLQGDWKWCRKCQCLTYAPNENTSVCAAGGHHDTKGSFIYYLPALH